MQPSLSEFHIRPNNSYHHTSWIWLLGGLGILSVGVAIRFALLGLWMILPFAILDLIAVAVLVQFSRHKSAFAEKVRITDDTVEIFHLQKNNDQRWSFPLYWTKVNLQAPEHHWYPNRLMLGASGKWVEIGQCLTDAERSALSLGIQDEIRRKLQSAPS